MTAAGRPREAIRALEAAARAYGSRRLRTFQAECELTLAWTLLREDPARARVVARRAARHFRSQDSPVPRAPGRGGGHRGGDLRRRPDAGAAAPGRGAEPGAAPERSPPRRRTAAAPGRARRDRPWSAAGGRGPHQARCASTPTRLLPPGCSRGRSGPSSPGHEGTGTGPAITCEQGSADLHEWQSSFGSLDLQSTLVGHGRDLALQGLRLALDDGRPSLAFEWSERARALTSRVAPVRSPADAQVASDLTELRLAPGRRPGSRPPGRPAGSPSCGRGSGSAAGTARAVALSASPPGWTRSRPRWRSATRRWWPTWSSTTGLPPSWSPPTTPGSWSWVGRAHCGTGSTPSPPT